MVGSHDFIYIGDVVEAWSSALTAPSTYSHVFNLGSGRRLSINELARHAMAAFGQELSPAMIRHAPARSGEQRHVEADIHAVRKALSWAPRVPFESGLAATCRWAASVADGAA